MISIVLPTYNEKENITKLIPLLMDFSKEKDIKLEIVVVDDNSPDGTSDYVRLMMKKYKNIVLHVRDRRLGQGSACYYGYKNSSGSKIIGMDVDLSHDPMEIPKILKKMENYDFVVASRHMEGGEYEKRRSETKIKYLYSYFGNKLARKVTNIDIHDFTNGFRGFDRKVLRDLDIKSSGNSFFMEFIIKVQKNGFKIGEIPSTFKDRESGESKLSILKESIKFLKDLFVFSYQ